MAYLKGACISSCLGLGLELSLVEVSIEMRADDAPGLGRYR